jgi:hypothetical protein
VEDLVAKGPGIVDHDLDPTKASSAVATMRSAAGQSATISVLTTASAPHCFMIGRVCSPGEAEV